MGKSKNGIFGSVNGKVGNLVFYKLHGEDLVRTLGQRTGKLSRAQLANCEKMSLIVKLFSKIKPFLKVGFGNEAKGTNKNYHNLATAYNKANAIDTVNEQPELNFGKIRLSQGSAIPAKGATVKFVDEGLQFSWSYDEQEDWDGRKDQVMMMAYFPDDQEASFVTSGARRKAGVDVLELHPSFRHKRMETYISFVSDDRESVATSVYLGGPN